MESFCEAERHTSAYSSKGRTKVLLVNGLCVILALLKLVIYIPKLITGDLTGTMLAQQTMIYSLFSFSLRTLCLPFFNDESRLPPPAGIHSYSLMPPSGPEERDMKLCKSWSS